MMFQKPNVNNVWAETGQVIQPNSAKVAQGWISEIPDYEFENWIQKRQDDFNAHVNQFGIPVWDSITEYIANKSYVQGSDGFVYKALTTNTNKNPTTSSSDWIRAFDSFDASYTKTEADARFLLESNNLSDLTNSATARTNLSVFSKSDSDARYLGQSLTTTVETVQATTGQTAINLNTQLTTNTPKVFVEGYAGFEPVFAFTITNSTTITLSNPIEADGSVRIIQEFTEQ